MRRFAADRAGWWGWAVLGWVAVCIAVIATAAILVNALVIGPNPWRDGDAYLNAAQRLRDGEALYPALTDYEAATVYRYAPWFAWAWIPLTYLPRELVVGLWQAAMLACSVVALVPAWRAGWTGRTIALVLVPLLLMASLIGNVQPAIVALLVHTVRSRWGPTAIAVTASLKVAPILYVVTYVAHRQWRRALISVGLTIALWMPAFLIGVEYYPTEIGSTTGLWTLSPAVWGVVVAGVAVGAYGMGRRTGAWYASSLLVALGTPRFISYDWTYLLVGARSRQPAEPSRRSSAYSRGDVPSRLTRVAP